jgi:hypothetical protein
MGSDPIRMLSDALGLADEQVTRLRRLWVEHVRESAPVQADLRIARVELQAMLAAQRVSMQEIEQKIREIQQLMGDLMIAGIRSFQQLKDVLNEQQLDRLQGMMSRMGMMGGMGTMGGPVPDRDGRDSGRGRGPSLHHHEGE